MRALITCTRWRAAAPLVLAALVASCGGSPRDGTTFTYWTSGWPPDQIKGIDAAFAKAHPGLHAEGQFIAASDQYFPKVVTAIKSGTQPTVIFTQNASDLPQLAQSGKVVPLDGKLTDETKALYPGIRKAAFYQGRQLGFPLSGAGDLVLFYNKDLLRAAGIAGPPQTWDELSADAARLSGGGRYGFYVPLGEAEWITYSWLPLLWANGGTLLSADGKRTAFDGPAGLKALTTWTDLVKKSSAPATSFAQAGSFDGAPAFASKTVAMIINGQWALSTFTEAGLNYGVAKLPEGDRGRATSIGVNTAAILETTPAQQAAGLEFIRFLATPQMGAQLAATSGGLPSDPAQLERPVLRDHAAKTPAYQVFSDSLPFGQTRPMTPAYGQISEALWTEIGNAVTGRKSPQRALTDAAKAGDAALAGED